MPINDLWSGWFGPDNPFDKGPESAYFSYQNQWRTPSEGKYYQGQFQEVQNKYLGQLGQKVLGGVEPSQTWADYLAKFNWGQNYQGLTPQQRGQDNSRFNPWTRWMV